MDKSLMWDELKDWLQKAVSTAYELLNDIDTNSSNIGRVSILKGKARGMDKVLMKMEDLERNQ